jgi:hypothetical protein
MRLMTKLVATFATLVLAVSLVGFVGSPAQAAKPRHSLTASPGTSSTGKTFIYGKAATLPNKKVNIQRKVKGGVWKLLKKADTNGQGKYKAFVSGPSQSCFRVVAPGNSKYRTAKVFVACLE